jgi:hypothetical protein
VRNLGVLALALTLGCGPVPGGSLAGEPTPVPLRWTEALGGDRAFCEIESRPADPHSIQLDCFVVDGALFVQSHRWVNSSWWPVESWASIWIAQPDVRVRVGERIFALRAEAVHDPALREPILRGRGYDPVPEGIVLFEFVPRDAAPPTR